ncbi:MAG: YHS domain-containing (seleno)protein [Synechococcus sp.]
MKVRYLMLMGALAGLTTVGAVTQFGFNQQATQQPGIAQAAPCAANPCADPCAANPCAPVDPCAANPCAANPCAAVDPCAANPCAANPCAANPCAAASADLAIYSEGGIAIDGTDPVAYFTDNAPVPGSAELTYEWGGATWQFSTEENRDLFASNPEAYAPQYGGHCAWAVAQGYSAPTVPDAWSIVDGKLYLNFDSSVQNRWERDVPGNIAKADANWPEVSQTI